MIKARRARWFMVTGMIMLILHYSDSFAREGRLKNINCSESSKTDTLGDQDNIISSRLPNGFSYVLHDNKDTSASIKIRLLVKTGFLAERTHEVQFAHLIEHAAFGRTKNFPAVFDFLTKSGLALGKDWGAFTGNNVTEYNLVVPKHKTQLFHECLKLVRDWCNSIYLDAQDIEREKLTILNEIDGGVDSTSMDIQDHLFSDPSLRRSLSDVVASVKGSHQADISEFYKKWYRADLQCVLIEGDIDVNETKEDIHRIFSSIPAPTGTVPTLVHELTLDPNATWLKEPRAIETRLIINIARLQDRRPIRSYQDLADEVTLHLFNKLSSKRLESIYCNTGVPVKSFLEFNDPFLSPQTGKNALIQRLIIKSEVDTSEVNAYVLKALEAQESIMNFGFDSLEFAAAKSDLQKELNNGMLISAGTFSERFTRSFADGDVLAGPKLLRKIYQHTIDTSTLSQLNANLSAWRMSRNLIITQAGPERWLRHFVNQHDFDRILNAVNVSPRSHGMTDSSLSDRFSNGLAVVSRHTDTLSKVLERKAIKEIGATTLKLSNNLRIIFKPTDRKGSTNLIIKGIKDRSTQDYQGKKYYSALHAANVARFSGIMGFSKQEVDLFLECNNIKFSLGVADSHIEIEAKGPHQEAEQLLQLIYSFLKAPTFSNDGLDKTVRFYKKRYDELNANMIKLDSIVGTYIDDESRLNRNSSMLKSLELEQAQRFYKEYFQDASEFTFLITGYFDMKVMEKLLTKYLGSLPATANPDDGRQNSTKTFAGKARSAYEFTEDNGKEGRHISLYFLSTQDLGLRDKVARQVAANILNSVLYQKIRWELGNVYYVSAFDNQLTSKNWLFMIDLTSKHGDDKKTVDAIWSEIENLSKHGPNKDALNSAISQIAARAKSLSETDDLFWSKHLFDQLKLGRELTEFHDMQSVLHSLTVRDVQQVFKELMSYSQQSIRP